LFRYPPSQPGPRWPRRYSVGIVLCLRPRQKSVPSPAAAAGRERLCYVLISSVRSSTSAWSLPWMLLRCKAFSKDTPIIPRISGSGNAFCGVRLCALHPWRRTTSAGTSPTPTRSATWTNTPDPTASSPSGARPKRSSGSASTAAAPTTPCLHLCASTGEHHHPQLDAPPGRRGRQALPRDVRHDLGGAARPATSDKYQLMHIEMFPYHIIHAECLGGDIDLLRSPSPLCSEDYHTASLRCATARLRRDHRLFAERVAFRRRRVVHRLGTSLGSRGPCRTEGLRVGRCVAMVDDAEYEKMIARRQRCPRRGLGTGTIRSTWRAFSG
jgi:hypothetical protein